ncbi:hypothetical protein O9929_16765 [Vibrio lentus]|nr:hypothetical protein [Vibrio lentus]
MAVTIQLADLLCCYGANILLEMFISCLSLFGDSSKTRTQHPKSAKSKPEFRQMEVVNI